MQIGEICTREVVHCQRDTSVTEIAQMMRTHHVGDVIVVEPKDGHLVPVGIVTDRDLVVEVLAQKLSPAELTAQDLMNGDLVTAEISESVYDAIWHMRSRRVRRLPVVEARGFLVGILTVNDVTEFLAEELTQIARIPSSQLRREKTELATTAA
jgi:CBS-domain-containing membrane protein